MRYSIDPDLGRVTASVVVSASYILKDGHWEGVVCVGDRQKNGMAAVINAFDNDEGMDIWTKVLGEEEAGKYADELEKARKESLRRAQIHEGAEHAE